MRDGAGGKACGNGERDRIAADLVFRLSGHAAGCAGAERRSLICLGQGIAGKGDALEIAEIRARDGDGGAGTAGGRGNRLDKRRRRHDGGNPGTAGDENAIRDGKYAGGYDYEKKAGRQDWARAHMMKYSILELDV